MIGNSSLLHQIIFLAKRIPQNSWQLIFSKIDFKIFSIHCSGRSNQVEPSLPEADHWYHGLNPRQHHLKLNISKGASWRLCWLHVPPSDLRRLKGSISNPTTLTLTDVFLSENRRACLDIVARSRKFARICPGPCYLGCCRLLQVIFSSYLCKNLSLYLCKN